MLARDLLLSRTESSAAVFEETRHPVGFHMPTHSDKTPHALFLLNGSIETVSKGKAQLAEAASLQFIPSDQPHSTRYSDDVQALYVMLRPPWWSGFGVSLDALQAPRAYRNCPTTWAAARLHQEFRARDRHTPFMLDCIAVELVVSMARSEERTRETGLPRWLSRVEELLQSTFPDCPNIEQLAATAAVHPGHLMRSFRRHYGCTVGDYVRKLQIERACALLRRDTNDEETWTIGRVAAELGFADQSSFCHAFRRALGMSPSEYRHQHRM